MEASDGDGAAEEKIGEYGRRRANAEGWEKGEGSELGMRCGLCVTSLRAGGGPLARRHALSFLTPCSAARPRPVRISSGFGHSQGKHALLLVAASSAVLVPPSPQRAPPHLFAIPRGLGVTPKLECAMRLV